ncbi:MAG TPA: phosphoglycerate kinase, partial [Acidimicrobiales bacterium]|nr:phosphoglycerate kinase [Acidimicrobiales bacterium]
MGLLQPPCRPGPDRRRGEPINVGIPTLEDLPDPSGKKVLLRADFNVPISNGKIDDDLRITAAMPTIEWLQGRGA